MKKLKLTTFEESDLVVLAEQTEARDVLGELHYILHALRESDGAILPHLNHGLGGKGRAGYSDQGDKKQGEKDNEEERHLPTLF